MTQLFTRDGKPVAEGTELLPHGKSGVAIRTKVMCGRCMGSGHYSFNLMDGTICYGCNGRKFKVEIVPVYSAEKLAKMDVTKGKAQARKQAQKAVQAAEQKVKADAAREVFMATHGALISRAQAVTGNDFVTDILAKLSDYGKLSDKQVEALTKAVEMSERKAKEVLTRRNGVGIVGNVITETASVVFRTVEPGFAYGTTTVFMILKHEDGTVFSYRGVGELADLNKGDKVKFTAKVKEHRTNSRGEVVTVLLRPKIIELTQAE